MAYNHEYPYVDASDYNDDWLLNTMLELKKEWENVVKEIEGKWEAYQEEIDDFKALVNQEIANFTNTITSQWVEYQTTVNQAFDTYKTELTEEWESFKELSKNDWNTFKTGIEAVIDAFKTDVLHDIADLESSWSAYQININNQITAQNAKIAEYKSYMDNFFDNLDVQSEINTKIDAMVTDGTMDTIINQQIFDGLNTKIDGTYEANAIHVMIGEPVTCAPTPVRILHARFPQMLNYLVAGRTFFYGLDSTGNSFFTSNSGRADGIGMLQAANVPEADKSKVRYIYLVSNGANAALPASTISTNMLGLLQYIRDTYPNALPVVLCCAWSDSITTKNQLIVLYTRLRNSINYGKCATFYPIFSSTRMFNGTKLTTQGLDYLCNNIQMVINNGDFIYPPYTSLTMFGTSNPIHTIATPSGLLVQTNGDITNMSGTIFITNSTYALASYSSGADLVRFPQYMSLPCGVQLFASDSTDVRVGSVGILNYNPTSKYVLLRILNSDIDISTYRSFTLSVNALIPWTDF